MLILIAQSASQITGNNKLPVVFLDEDLLSDFLLSFTLSRSIYFISFKVSVYRSSFEDYIIDILGDLPSLKGLPVVTLVLKGI